MTSETFKDHEIFLTGANGFLGKVILALLLDRYPEVRQVHILIRPRADVSAAERFADEVLRSPAFAPMIESKGREFIEKRISVWAGDIGSPLFGLDATSRDQLAGRVSLILNCAGRVDFFPPLDESFRSNVDGAAHAVELAQFFRAPLLHVSTAFVCGETDGLVEETEPILGFYPHRRGPDDHRFSHLEEVEWAREAMRQMIENSSKDAGRSRELTRRLSNLGRQRAASWGWVNTYTYSKSLGEQIIASAPGLNWSIVRPAIIESAWRFPFPGWIEGGRTAAPLVLMALGGLTEWPVRDDAPLEIVPVDMAAAAILIVAARLLRTQSLPVYQLGSADSNPCTLGSTIKLLVREARRRARNGNRFTGRLSGSMRKARFLSAEEARSRRARLQAKIERYQRWAEAGREAIGKTGLPGGARFSRWAAELRRLSLQANFREQTLEQYLPFVLQNRYIFESESIRAARADLSQQEQERLTWAPEEIDWDDYWVHNQITGIEKWVQPEAVREWSFTI